MDMAHGLPNVIWLGLGFGWFLVLESWTRCSRSRVTFAFRNANRYLVGIVAAYQWLQVVLEAARRSNGRGSRTIG
jgi:hypothetical protein